MINKFWQLIANQLARPFVTSVLLSLAKRTPYCHLYNEDGSLYMGRWWLLKERSWFPYAVRVHHIATADDVQDYHDHPYDYRTIILSGWYVETLPNFIFYRMTPGRTVAHRAEHFHHISKVAPEGVFTLFIYRPTRKHNSWGFLTVDGNGGVVKKGWKEYARDKHLKGSK